MIPHPAFCFFPILGSTTSFQLLLPAPPPLGNMLEHWSWQRRISTSTRIPLKLYVMAMRGGNWTREESNKFSSRKRTALNQWPGVGARAHMWNALTVLPACYYCYACSQARPPKSGLKNCYRFRIKAPFRVTNTKALSCLDTIANAKAPFGTCAVCNACRCATITCFYSYPASSFPAQSRRAADPDRSWVALGTFSRTQKPGHAHRQALGVLIKKMSVPYFQLYFFSPKPRF
jgi:hypothetical protein